MQLLTEDAIQFLSDLHNAFDERRRNLLLERVRRQDEFDVGLLPGFLPETKHIRESEWQVPEAPADLRDRRVEITGPVDRKMMINALNSGAKVFMADFEDATSPTWSNILEGQQNLIDAHRRTLSLDTPDKQYRLNEETATLVVRPRGWHLPEKHLEFQGGRRRRRWSTSVCTCIGAAEKPSQPDRDRISTCPSWNRPTKPGCGTTSSHTRRSVSTSRQGRSGRPS